MKGIEAGGTEAVIAVPFLSSREVREEATAARPLLVTVP